MAQLSTAWFGSVWDNMAQHGLARLSLALQNSAWTGTAQLGMGQHGTEHLGTAQHGLAWLSVAQHCTAHLPMALQFMGVWRDMPWHSSIWHSTALSRALPTPIGSRAKPPSPFPTQGAQRVLLTAALPNWFQFRFPLHQAAHAPSALTLPLGAQLKMSI